MTDIHNPSFWDTAAVDYRATVDDFTAYYSEQAWQLAAVPAGAKVLDIAAGAGALTQFAAGAGHEVLATDFSGGMVNAIAARNLPGVTAQVMDGQALDLAGDSFDAAFSMFGIMLFPDWKAGLSEMVRVLKPGGIGCIGTWKEPGGAAVNLLISAMAKWKFPHLDIPVTVPGMVEWTLRERFAAVLEQAGLHDLRFHEVVSNFRVDVPMLLDPERLFQFSPIWPSLDLQEKAEMLAELRDLAKRSGGIEVASPAVIAIGIKALN